MFLICFEKWAFHTSGLRVPSKEQLLGSLKTVSS